MKEDISLNNSNTTKNIQLGQTQQIPTPQSTQNNNQLPSIKQIQQPLQIQQFPPENPPQKINIPNIKQPPLVNQFPIPKQQQQPQIHNTQIVPTNEPSVEELRERVRIARAKVEEEQRKHNKQTQEMEMRMRERNRRIIEKQRSIEELDRTRKEKNEKIELDRKKKEKDELDRKQKEKEELDRKNKEEQNRRELASILSKKEAVNLVHLVPKPQVPKEVSLKPTEEELEISGILNRRFHFVKNYSVDGPMKDKLNEMYLAIQKK